MNRLRLSFYGLLAFSFLTTSCHTSYHIQQRTNENYPITETLPQDSVMNVFLLPYKKGVDTQMKVVIGSTDIMLTKAQPECTLGNFIADAQLEGAKKIDSKIDFSVMNYGGIRLSYIQAGAITKEKMYELMPFDNKLTIVEIPGNVVQQFCNYMAKIKGWPVSGISYVIKDRKATNITIQGKPLNEHLIYKMAISDYIANGGDNCDFLSKLDKKYTSLFVRDLMIDYVKALQKQNKPLHPLIENRISYAE
jgi:2',3'-cyclic-nucleotide 2'-phosphodiesterase (5'-nucleotidase family)